MRNINSKMLATLCVLCLSLSACAADSTYSGIVVPRGEEHKAEYSVGSNWQYAKNLQAEGRYEIAKEYFLLALSAAQTVEEQKWLERELYVVDLQIKSRR